MAAAAGKTSTTSLPLFMEAFGLEVEEGLCTLATQYWAEGVGIGEWHHEQKEAWMNQIFEDQTWRVRGPAGAEVCETKDLGIKWPHWHALIFKCPKAVKKMLLQQARTYWKKWAAKHEYEELKEGVWLEPALVLLRKKTKEDWTEKASNCCQKLDSSTSVGRMKVNVKLVTKRKVQKKHRLYHCPEWQEMRRDIPSLEPAREWGAHAGRQVRGFAGAVVCETTVAHFLKVKYKFM